MHGGPPEERACAAQRAPGAGVNAAALARALFLCRAEPTGHAWCAPERVCLRAHARKLYRCMLA
eukprot:5223967-Alexandrium_andersonii.AAC.1